MHVGGGARKRNIFNIPSGKMGEQFVSELSSLFQSYGASNARGSFSAAMTMPSLLLQKPRPKSTSEEHVQVLVRRLDEWKKDNVSSLLHEGRCI